MERIVALSTRVEQAFNTHRGTLDGVELSGNEILDILLVETDEARRRGAWEASKQVGPVVADDLRELVRLRNQAARDLGYPDFYQMQLLLDEQDPVVVEALFDELATLTEAPFLEVKGHLDVVLAERYGIEPSQMRPWHYADPFFQEVPAFTSTDLDGFYEGADVVALSVDYFAGIGLDPAGIIARSDLLPRDGKQPSAFCIDLDRQGDVRVLANVDDDEYWMGTMLHELGHAVYDAELDPGLPFVLRTPAHAFTTEAVALLFGRLSKDPEWFAGVVGVPDEELAPARADLAASSRALMLIFARWSLVMVDFERALYADPEADLDALWWDLVEEHQHLRRPEGRSEADWATKIHVVSTPAYYHNYLMGEMLASQLLAAMDRDVLHGAPMVGRPEVGAWMTERVFAPGARSHWSELVQDATGEELTPRWFVEEYVAVE